MNLKDKIIGTLLILLVLAIRIGVILGIIYLITKFVLYIIANN